MSIWYQSIEHLLGLRRKGNRLRRASEINEIRWRQLGVNSHWRTVRTVTKILVVRDVYC